MLMRSLTMTPPLAAPVVQWDSLDVDATIGWIMRDEAFLTTEEVLHYLQVNLRTVYRLIKAGVIPAVRVGRQWRFRRSDIDDWLARQQRERASASSTPGTSASSSPGPAPAALAPNAGRRVRILVADDEPSIREMLEKTLTLADYEVIEVENGGQVLDRLRSSAFDLLITDLKMPGMDGLAVIREARRLCPDLPVVIITGHSSEASAIAAIDLGVSGYLTKPFRVSKVLAVAAKALGE